jgi:molybdopterin-guanine dinucleotide biosynthesis protein A
MPKPCNVMHSAAILAGGRATRFGGRDKGALLVDGQTIRARQLAMLSEVADEVLIVGGESGAGLPADRRAEALRHIPDLVLGCGPMGGVHAAVCAARHDAVFVIACDMPYVTAAFAAHLLDLAHDVDAVVPRTERGLHPLCAVYTRACRERLATRLAAGSLQMRGFLDDVRIRVIEAEDIEVFGDRHRLLANVNTPADYAGLEALPGHKR